MAQQYVAGGDAVVGETGAWFCEHEEPPHRELHDPRGARPVDCPDCGTRWVCWTLGVRRLAKPVVVPG